jgi:PAS domain S-box-containing protein
VDELAELQRVSERAARLQRVTASLAAALTVEAVARIALDDAVAELQGDRGSFMFPVQGRMRAVAVIGYDTEGVTQLERRWAEGQLSPTLHAYRTGAGVWIETADERDAQFPSLSGSEPGVVATCAVPMLVAEHTVGVFRVSFLESRLFTDDERSFAEALGAVAAQALERVSLYDEKARTADRLTRLQSVSAALARTRSLADALDVTIRHATGLVGAQVASVSLLDADDQRTIRLLRVEPPTETSAAWSTYDVGDALPTSEAIRTGAIVTAESVAERDARWPAMSMVDWGFDHSLLVLPLHVEDTSVGALTLSFAKQAAGEEPDQAFLMAFADACAQALERARAAERAAIANRRLRLLARASSQLAASLDIERTLASVARLVVPEIADWCVVHLLVNGELTAVASEHSDPLKRQLALEVQQRFPERLSDEGGVGEVVRTGRSKLIPDIAEIPADQFVERHPEHTAVITELGLSSVIIVPLLARGRTLGSITLIAAESGQRYTQADVEFAEEIAARAAVAIDNANLFTGNAAVAAHRLLDSSMGDDAEAVGLLPVAPQRADSVSVTPEGRNELARLLETMTDAFFRLDREWRFTYINSQAERLLFRSRNELLGTKIWEQYPDAIGSQFDEKYSSALATGQAVAFEEFFVPLDTWFEVRAMPDAGGLSVFFHDVSTRKRAEDARALASERLALLGEATRGLVGTLDITTVLRQVTAVVVPRFADWAIVSLLDQAGVVEASHAVHADAEKAAAMARLLELHGDALLGSPALHPVVQSGESLIWPAVSVKQLEGAVGDEELAMLLWDLGVASALVVPLQSGAATLGVLCLFKGPGASPFTAEDRVTAADIGRRAGLALDNARLYERQRTASEVLQRSLLTPLPEPDHLQIAARYLPAAQEAQVGGDWYDAFLQPDGATVIAIGDVVGHDMNAAAAMGQLRNLLRGIAYDSQDGPANVLSRVDFAIRGLQIDTLATAVVARVEQTVEQRSRMERTLRWANAGHPPPFLVRANGIVNVLDTDDGMLLGLDPESGRHDHVVTMVPGDTLILFTDGLVERRDSPIEEGLARLAECLAAVHDLPLEDLLSELVASLLPVNADDDVAVLALRAFREDRARPPEAGPENVPVDVPEHL